MRHCITLLLVLLSGCKSLPPTTDGPSIWCNVSYVTAGVFHNDALAIARGGYIYSLASSLALENDPPWFRANNRLREVDRKAHDRTDFLAKTFELMDVENPGGIDEIVIAYAGSDSWYDWIFVNLPFGGAPAHYEQGRIYAKEIYNRYKERMGTVPPIVVTGASLGGGIAVHVTKHNDTRKLITKAWVFNSSPKTLVDSTEDDRIWAASMKGEVLFPIRAWFRVARGLGGIGLVQGHSYHGYNLVHSNFVFQHYNYVLTRNLLHAADYALKIPHAIPSQLRDEPIHTLQLSSDRNCTSPAYQVSPELRY